MDRDAAPNRHLRLALAVALAGFLVLNIVLRSWLYVAMAAIWLGLLGLRELVQRRNPPE